MTDDQPGRDVLLRRPPSEPRARVIGHPGEAGLLALAFLLVNLAGAWFQPQITKDGGKGWEGIDYHAMAVGMARGDHPVTADAPMVFRAGTSALAAVVHRAGWNGGDLFAAFRGVNLIANALSLILLVAWLRRFIGDWRVRTALGLGWLLQWDTPTRWLWFYPAHADPWMWVFLLGGSLAADRYRREPSPGRLALLTAVCAVGVLFREVVAVVTLAFLFSGNPVRRTESGRWQIRPPHPAMALPLVAALGAVFALRHGGLVRQSGDYAFAGTALHWLHAKRPWIYVHGWLAAFGPGLLALVLVGWRQARNFLAERQDLAVYLLVFAVLGQAGGTDTERLVYWTMPVVFLLAGRALESDLAAGPRPTALLVTLAVVQLVASRALFWPIPDYPDDGANPSVFPLLTPLGTRVPYLDLFSFFAPHRLELTLLLSNLVALGLLGAWIVRVRRRTAVGKTLRTEV